MSSAGEGGRVLSSRAREDWGVQSYLCPATGLGSGVGEMVVRGGGEEMRIFCYQCGLWAGLRGVRETCNGPEHLRALSLGGIHSSVAAGTKGSWLCLLE